MVRLHQIPRISSPALNVLLMGPLVTWISNFIKPAGTQQHFSSFSVEIFKAKACNLLFATVLASLGLEVDARLAQISFWNMCLGKCLRFLQKMAGKKTSWIQDHQQSFQP